MEPLWILLRGVIAAFVLWLVVVWLVYSAAHAANTAAVFHMSTVDMEHTL